MAEELSTAHPSEPAGITELRELVKRAEAGDTGALPRIREILDQHPEVWHHLGDLAALAEVSWIRAVAGDNLVAVESLKRTAAEMRAELISEHPTRLERLLVDQVVATLMESKYAESVSASSGAGSLQQARYRLKRLESAQKRFESAVLTLSNVRALVPSAREPSESIHLYEGKKRTRA